MISILRTNLKINLSNIIHSKAIGFLDKKVAKLFITREKKGIHYTKIVTGPFRTGVL